MSINPPDISIIIPTLNEQRHMKRLLSSLKDQSPVSFEVWVIDGGSKDKTAEIARRHNAEVIILPNYGEFISRNIGAKRARGKILLFTCADVTFPQNLLPRVTEKFKKKPELIALTGPGIPFDASLFGKLEYMVYNIARFAFARFPKPLKRFSTSTNFLAVRKDYFDKTGGFQVDEINADGLMGKRLLETGKTAFFFDTKVFISARRMKNMGFFAFNRHYFYVFENLFFFLENTRIIKNLKTSSKMKHRKMHEI